MKPIVRVRNQQDPTTNAPGAEPFYFSHADLHVQRGKRVSGVIHSATRSGGSAEEAERRAITAVLNGYECSDGASRVAGKLPGEADHYRMREKATGEWRDVEVIQAPK